MVDEDASGLWGELPEEVLHSLGEGVTLADTEGRIVFSNRTADRILGVGGTDAPPEEWAAHYGVFLPDDRDEPFPADRYPLLRALKGEATHDVEMWIRNPGLPDGALISVTGQPIQDDSGKIVGAAVVFRDMTKLRGAQEELERTVAQLAETQRQKDELVAFVVHDLKGPITGIMLAAELLMAELDLGDEDRETLVDVHAAAKTLHRMVLDLLDIRLAEDGLLRLDVVSVRLGDVLRDVSKSHRALAAGTGTDLRVVEPEGELTVSADADLLRRIVTNLVANSFKYASGGTVRVGAGRLEDPPRCRITVEDDGPGVPLELREEIFRMWNTLERDARGRHRDSRGIGLHFARQATEAHGGSIRVEDSDLGGARFCLELPMG